MTELEDGLFIGCCINHFLADATSLTHCLNVLSQIKLPYLDADEFLTRFDEGNLRDRVFHFISDSMKTLKSKARVLPLSGDEETTLSMPVNLRSFLKPPLSLYFFASFATGIMVTVKVGELLTNGLE